MIVVKDAHEIPSQTGVYFFNTKSKPIYIGKSVNIRARVKSHIAQAELSNKERHIITEADSITYKITLSNFDALILESQLIKEFKPKYNAIWKDDKHFLYIKITIRDRYPKVFPVRKEDDGSSLYFGPFSSSQMTYDLINEIRYTIPFCMQRKLGKRPCFYARIGLCSPCPNYIENLKDEVEKQKLRNMYKKRVRNLVDLLSGKSNILLNTYDRRLEKLVKEQKYEEAISVRNKLLKFSLFLERRSFTNIQLTREIDTQGLHDEINTFLKSYFGSSNNKSNYRIECFDISNLMGKQATGSMVVFENGNFVKSAYKKFLIKKQHTSAIYMLKEVLVRRFKHTEWPKPDLIILDGGKPQLQTIQAYFSMKHIFIPLISIAKRPDRIIDPSQSYSSIMIDRHSMFFKLIQALRDESHRFAKKYHILLRNRNLLN